MVDTDPDKWGTPICRSLIMTAFLVLGTVLAAQFTLRDDERI